MSRIIKAVPFDYLREKCTYLGKSKVNISDLFEAQE